MWRRLPFLIGCLPGPTRSQGKFTAMHYAAYAGKFDIVSYLDKKHPKLWEFKDNVRQPPHSPRPSYKLS